MTFWTLIVRGLRFHAREHLGATLGTAIGGAALIGALIVGDSARLSLRERALRRVGEVHSVLTADGGLFRAELAGEIEAGLKSAGGGGMAAPVLRLPAMAARSDGTARANTTRVFGVPAGFAGLARARVFEKLAPGSVLLNEALARQLAVQAGDPVILRIVRPSALGQDSPLAPRSGQTAVLRLTVAGVVSGAELGDLDFAAAQLPPFNAFVPLATLQEAVAQPGRANLVLLNREAGRRAPEMVREKIRLEDFGLKLAILPDAQTVELSSPRVFLEAAAARAGLDAGVAGTNGIPILTYLANQLRTEGEAAPYSMVAAAGPPYTPADLKDHEIVVNQWLAEDLGLQPGDWMDLRFFAPESGFRLIETGAWFCVRSIAPMRPPWADRTLMPEFPGIEKAETTSDWDAGFPLEYSIRPKDEAYWKEYRGTPKAFLSPDAGRKLWANRFGSLTAIRYPVPAGIDPAAYRATIEAKLSARLKAEAIGPRLEPVREQALKAAEQGQDFGRLFLGLSFFLVAGALLLVAMLFRFGLEQRAAETGTLLALGFTARQVRRLWLGEGIVVALAGGLLGAAGGVGYAKAMLFGLATVWRAAVGGAALEFHLTAMTLLIGLCASTVIAIATIWLTVRGQTRRPALELLFGEEGTGECAGEFEARRPRLPVFRRATWLAGMAALGALAILGWTLGVRTRVSAEAFFGAGSLLLLAGLALAFAGLGGLERTTRLTAMTRLSLGARGCVRRRNRSLTVVALLAGGSFLIASLGAFRLDAGRDAGRRDSGTGGFTWIGQMTMPLTRDLNTKAGREFYGLDPFALRGMVVVPARVHDGEEASCLNLNRARQPRLLGVKPALLSGRFPFAEMLKTPDGRRWWALLLRQNTNTDEIPAIGDAASIEWALGKKVGDTLDYTDEQGRPFKLRLAGALGNSIFQGSLIIDEEAFVSKFPSQGGYRMLLMEAPASLAPGIAASLSRALQDEGLELTPAARRLNEFNAVQNTYLATFQVLGGLGLLLGSAGLGIVVLRNVLERRGELAVLAAVGWSRPAIRRLVLWEHLALLAVGLVIGLLSAGVAVMPALLSPGAALPLGSLGWTLGAVLLNGVACAWLAVRRALRGNLVDALRNE